MIAKVISFFGKFERHRKLDKESVCFLYWKQQKLDKQEKTGFFYQKMENA